ncbi:MAG: ComEC/Rec2 family competence protein, partial [Caldilineaceae bacterium]|nr:ComEC/Rec2 family competence protein [Caldilineaceae bacterium]
MVAEAVRQQDAETNPLSLWRWVREGASAQEGRTFLWAPLFLTLGIWSYFALDTEPVAGVAIALVLAVIGLVWVAPRSSPALLAALMVFGFVLVKARADWASGPLLHASTANVEISGTVEHVDKGAARRFDIILSPGVIEGLPPGQMPHRLRLSVSEKLGVPLAGQRITFKARLFPLPSPVEPGGFDYGRKLWFDGIGGTGRVTSVISVLSTDQSLDYVFLRTMTGLRTAMGARIHDSLSGTSASIAEALITGERATIPRDVNQSLMTSGLFHVLSISGLHMWMVAGGVFFAVRGLLALSPVLALRFPIKKFAAVAALLMGFFYMLLADSGVATDRSFIMIAVVFFAVLVDRPALSSRNLAIAAVTILVMKPESAIDASFQMSFLAVLGLVAFYEYWSRRSRDDRHHNGHHPWGYQLIRRAGLSVFLALVTTTVAGGMSSIPAVYHFGRLAPYSIISNGLAFPVIGVLVMPMALLSAILMPLGLEGPPLWVMGQGLHLVLLISDWVAQFPDAMVIVARPGELAMLLLGIGATATCLLAGSLRWLGVLPVVLSLALMTMGRPHPDLLVERFGANVAIRSADGRLVPAIARKSRFVIGRWLQSNGEESTPAEAAKRQGWTCTAGRCNATVRNQRIVYLMDEHQAIDCAGIDILVASFPLRGACGAVPTRIDRFDLWRGGAHALFIEEGANRIVTSRQAQGRRPWVVVPVPRKNRVGAFRGAARSSLVKLSKSIERVVLAGRP